MKPPLLENPVSLRHHPPLKMSIPQNMQVIKVKPFVSQTEAAIINPEPADLLSPMSRRVRRSMYHPSEHFGHTENIRRLYAQTLANVYSVGLRYALSIIHRFVGHHLSLRVRSRCCICGVSLLE